MKFVIEPSPPVEIANDPDQVHPASRFIDLGLPGLVSAWVYDGKRFAVALDTRDPEAALHELGRDGGATTLEALMATPSAAHGDLFFQQREDDVVHVEYATYWVRGRETRGDEWLERDREIE